MIHEIFREPTAEFGKIAIFWIHLHNDSTHLFQLHVEKQDATKKWPNQPVLQAVHSCFAMFHIRIAENRLFLGFHYNPLIDLYPLLLNSHAPRNIKVVVALPPPC
jgi:hypothetical protein